MYKKIALALLFASCEKVIDLDYKSNQSKIVIEGNITNEAGPYLVKITKSMSLTETGAYTTIDDATVSISDDAGNSETLVSQGNGVYNTTTLTGVEGRTYTLTVHAEGQTYTAQSTMPQQVPFDSIKVEKTTVMGNEINYNFIPVYQDPMEVGNNYRFVLWLNNQLIKQHLVLNDEVKNGQVNTIKLELDDDDLELKPGDLINIEMQCIDKKVSLFYTALALMGDTGPGGGTTPNNPPNNISNGALGVFSAHTVATKSVTVP
ncbi:MAG: DUF4249 domain-containing protein [Candidatus Symbiothrix sp.]|jgi:hypothetical protein|nr:DUF4249 domain-containing protein [Candidatus Symbiothrix sp.]